MDSHLRPLHFLHVQSSYQTHNLSVSWKKCRIKLRDTKDILYLNGSQPPCLSQSGEPPVSSAYRLLCSVTSRMSRNLENHPGRPLTILPRSSRAPALAPWFLVAASIWKKKAAEATLADKVWTITMKRCAALWKRRQI